MVGFVETRRATGVLVAAGTAAEFVQAGFGMDRVKLPVPITADREEIARQLLCDTDIPVTRVAAALGYGDATVFTRAFTRWTGQTPSEFRAQLPR